jgi:hypothetical protein
LNWVPLFGVLLGVLAVIFGIIGARRARARGTGRVQARTGWILGSITIVLGVVLTAVILNQTNHASKARIEAAISDYYTNALHQPTKSVSCLGGLDEKAGASEACFVTLSDGSTETATFTITSVSGNNLTFMIVVS